MPAVEDGLFVDLHAIKVKVTDVQDPDIIAGPLPNLGGKVIDLLGPRHRWLLRAASVDQKDIDVAGRVAILACSTAEQISVLWLDLPGLNETCESLHVAPGTRVITDGWAGYRGLDQLGYTHEPRSQRAALARGEDPGELLPAVYRVTSLA